MLFTTALLIVRNQRILAAWNARQEDNQRRAAKGLPPRTRRRRRRTLRCLTRPLGERGGCYSRFAASTSQVLTVAI